jgi:hypothetical protein
VGGVMGLLQQLQAVPVEFFEFDCQPIVDALEEEEAGLDAVETILMFMEKHPEIDFGGPGSLVHFVERFFRKGYEPLLLASIARCPTDHTRFMLHRLINGTEAEAERNRLSAILEAAHG